MVEKRRRKKSRIQAESSSEDSDSDFNHQENASDNDLSELSDVEMTSALPETANPETPRERLHKTPANAESDFNQVFMTMITEQFAKDLDALRQSKDFRPASIQSLVAGLKQGADIFTADQKRLLN